MLHYHSLEGFFFIFLGDKLSEKFAKTFVVGVIIAFCSISIGFSSLAVAGKGWICGFGSVLKSANQVREFAIIVNKVFSDCFQRTQAQ